MADSRKRTHRVPRTRQTPPQQAVSTGRQRRAGHDSPQRQQAKPARPQEEAYCRALIEHAFESVYITDRTGTIRSIIPTTAQLFGYTPDDLRGKNGFAFIHPDDEPALRAAFTQVLRHPCVPVRREYRIRHKDGSWRVCEGIATNLLAHPTVAGIVINARDITERKQTEMALRESEDRYRQLVEWCPDPIVVHSEDHLRYANGAALALFGARRAEDLIGTSIWDLVHPDHHDVVTQRLKEIRTEGRAAQVLALTLIRLDGQIIEVEAAGAAITYAGKPAIQAVIRDITERKRTEQALGDSEERYRHLFENANDAIATFTVEGVFTSMNRGAEILLGWSRDELIGHHYHMVTTPAFAALADDRTRRFLAGEEMSSIFDSELVCKDGRIVPVEARTRPIRDRQGALIGFQGIYRDITERKQAERELRQSEEKYRKVFALSPDFLYVTDAAGNILNANQVLLERQGLSLEEMRQKNVLDFFAGEHPQVVQQAGVKLREGQAIQCLEVQARDAQGQISIYEVNAIPLLEEGQITQVLSLARDITARKQAEAQVQESHRTRERIADTMPDILYVYALPEQRWTYVNRQIFTILGYPPEHILATRGPLFHDLLHPDDGQALAERTAKLRTATEGEVVQSEFRLKHATGGWRSVRVRETIFTRTPEGTPGEILGVAQDITEQQKLAALLKERVTDRQGMPARLREFRHALGLTQAKFGEKFGGYSQAQISAYEQGEADVSLSLILAIREKGYPIEALIGGGSSEVIDKTVAYLPASHHAKVLARRLTAALLQLLDQDCQTVEEIMQGLGLPYKDLTSEQHRLLTQLLNLASEGES